MEEDKAAGSEDSSRRVVSVSAGASHTVALLCKCLGSPTWHDSSHWDGDIAILIQKPKS
jgi:hypothetical protein